MCVCVCFLRKWRENLHLLKVLVQCRQGCGREVGRVVNGCAVYTVYRLSLASLPLA